VHREFQNSPPKKKVVFQKGGHPLRLCMETKSSSGLIHQGTIGDQSLNFFQGCLGGGERGHQQKCKKRISSSRLKRNDREPGTEGDGNWKRKVEEKVSFITPANRNQQGKVKGKAKDRRSYKKTTQS